MSWPALLLWALVVPLALLRGPALIYAALIVNVFMSLQMMPGSGGGSTLLPVSVFEVALVARFLFVPGNLLRGLDAALDMRRLGLLSAFLVYALVGAFVLPRMFANMVAVIPVAGASLDGPSLLVPRSGNYTQSGYMILSSMTALVFAVIGDQPDVRRHILRAIIAGAFALIVTGLADMYAGSLGVGAMLEPFRTASYELLTDAEAGGMKRIVGLTPEASSFGSICVQSAAALLFLRPLYRQGRARWAADVALIGVVAMALLSTSSTAYVGLFVTGCMYLLDLLRRLYSPAALGRNSLPLEIFALAAAAIGVVVVIAFVPSVSHYVSDLLDKLIFNKTATTSYVQRSMWTRIGWESFIGTGGLGVGLGSVRTSNWVVSIIASTGALGAALMFGFIVQKIFASRRYASEWDRSFVWGLRLVVVPSMIMSLLAGTIPDLGIMLSMVLGLLSVRPRSAPFEPLPTLARSRNLSRDLRAAE